MLAPLKDIYNKAENLKGKHLLYVLLGSISVFLLLGLYVGYTTNKILKKSEITQNYASASNINKVNYYEGRVIYIDPVTYPDENISYYLGNDKGNIIILLKTDDQKLMVSEGYYVKAYGKLEYTKKGGKVLNVEKLVVPANSN